MKDENNAEKAKTIYENQQIMKHLLKIVYNNLIKPVNDELIGKHHKPSFTKAFPVVGFLSIDDKKNIEKTLHIKIKNIAYYEQAFLHRSYMHVLKIENTDCPSNERLEFFGDAILEFVVSEYLFNFFTNEFEGELSKMRSNIVSRKSMAICGRELGIGQYLRVSYSARKNLDSGLSESMISDLMEAVIGAVYLDNDLDVVRAFILEQLLPIVFQKGLMADENYKSQFMETVQADGFNSPTYQTIEEVGLPHDKIYNVGVFLNEERIATGDGRSKKCAEQNAAKNALDIYINRRTNQKNA